MYLIKDAAFTIVYSRKETLNPPPQKKITKEKKTTREGRWKERMLGEVDHTAAMPSLRRIYNEICGRKASWSGAFCWDERSREKGQAIRKLAQVAGLTYRRKRKHRLNHGKLQIQELRVWGGGGKTKHSERLQQEAITGNENRKGLIWTHSNQLELSAAQKE